MVAVRRSIILGLLGFWLVVMLYMSVTLYQSTEQRSSGMELFEKQLVDALLELNELKRENKKLFNIAQQLR